MNLLSKYLQWCCALILGWTLIQSGPVYARGQRDLAAAEMSVPAIELDLIEVEGVKSLNTADVEGVVLLSPGDVLERTRLVQTVKGLQSLYQLRGYQDVKVTSELIRRKNELGKLETVLKLLVEEGLPSRIGSIQLNLINVRDPEFRSKLWNRIEATLLESSRVKIGDIFDQEKVGDVRRAFEDLLASEEFIGAKIEDVRLRLMDVPPPEAVALQAKRWVQLDFQVNLGERVSFGFRGNERLTRNDLMDLVQEQRVLGFSQDYVQAIAERIRQKYRSIGYGNTAVESYTFEEPAKQERHITYTIKEGIRVKIEDIDFDGNFVFDDLTLKKEFFEIAPPLTQRRIFVQEEVDSAADLLLEWIKSKGYLSAKLITVSSSTIAKGDSVKLLIYLYEGERTLVRNLTLSGVKFFSPIEVEKIISARPGEPINLYAFSEGLETLKSKYRSRGFLGVRIENENQDNVVKYSQKNRIADIEIVVDEGPQFRASEIKIIGLSATLPHIVRRELLFKEGDVLEEDKISESESRLRRLSLFSDVSIQLREQPDRAGFKDVRVVVKEANPGIMAGGIGVRNDLGIRVFGSLAYTSLWKRNHTWSLSGSVNRRFEDFCVQRSGETQCFAEYQARMGYSWPWFLIDEADFRPSITIEKRRYNQFDSQSAAFSATLEKKVLRYVPLYASMTYNLERTILFNARKTIDNQGLTIGALEPSVKLDYRDNPLAPTSGFFANVTYEYASPAFGSQSDPFSVGYSRVQFRGDQFVPLSKSVQWYLSFRTGWERNNIESSDERVAIPLSKQFALGGAGSLRGFDLQELNVQSQAIRGTLSYVNYRTQIDLPLAGQMRFGPFLDAGNLFVDSYSLGNVRFGTGFGFHYQTPVGPVNFDWGFKIKPRKGESPQSFYFSVGVL